MQIARKAPILTVSEDTGAVTWISLLNDFNQNVFQPGHRVTADEWKDLFLRTFYQTNYTADSLKEFLGVQLPIALTRQIKNNIASEKSYVMPFDSTNWTSEADADGLYYITISADTHGIISGTIDNGDTLPTIATTMYILQSNDSYLEIKNQSYITTENDVVVFSDNKDFEGFIVIQSSALAYRFTDTILDASMIGGLAAVAKTGATADLVDWDSVGETRFTDIETDINKIVTGVTTIPLAQDVINVTGTIGNRAITDIFETGSTTVKNATKAIKDSGDNVINTTYMRLDDTALHSNMKVGYATKDSGDNVINTTYMRLDDTALHSNMKVGFATEAGKATNDIDGLPIKDTYLKRIHAINYYPNISVFTALFPSNEVPGVYQSRINCSRVGNLCFIKFKLYTGLSDIGATGQRITTLDAQYRPVNIEYVPLIGSSVGGNFNRITTLYIHQNGDITLQTLAERWMYYTGTIFYICND